MERVIQSTRVLTLSNRDGTKGPRITTPRSPNHRAGLGVVPQLGPFYWPGLTILEPALDLNGAVAPKRAGKLRVVDRQRMSSPLRTLSSCEGLLLAPGPYTSRLNSRRKASRPPPAFIAASIAFATVRPVQLWQANR